MEVMGTRGATSWCCGAGAAGSAAHSIWGGAILGVESFCASTQFVRHAAGSSVLWNFRGNIRVAAAAWLYAWEKVRSATTPGISFNFDSDTSDFSLQPPARELQAWDLHDTVLLKNFRHEICSRTSAKKPGSSGGTCVRALSCWMKIGPS